MDKLASSESAIKTSLLYLYQSLKESGMSEEDAKKGVGQFVIKELSKIDALKAFKIMPLDAQHTQTLKTIQCNVELLVKSPQLHVSVIGKSLAEQFSKLLD